jgi:hypothetical protein
VYVTTVEAASSSCAIGPPGNINVQFFLQNANILVGKSDVLYSIYDRRMRELSLVLKAGLSSSPNRSSWVNENVNNV